MPMVVGSGFGHGAHSSRRWKVEEVEVEVEHRERKEETKCG